MKRFIMLMLCASVSAARVQACDVCGCSASNQYLGILPQYQYHFIGLQYQYNSFSSSHPSLFEGKPDDRSEDYYHTVQLWGRYNITKRLQVFAFLPYRTNTQQADDSVRTTSSGIGDASFLINYLLIREDGITSGWKQQLLAGGGLKLPTGGYTGITAQDRQGLPNMQPGTGSWDFMVNANYTVRKSQTGFNVDAAYTLTTANKESYKYGNRLNAGLLGFYSLQYKDVSLLPQAGIRYEHTLHDYDNYSRKWLNEQSGGYMCFATAGVQAYYKKVGLRLTWQLPVSQHYGDGYVTAKQKLDAGVFLLF